MKHYNPHENEDRLRVTLAVVISLAVLLGYYFLVDKPEQQRLAAARQAQVEQEMAQPRDAAAPADVLRERKAVVGNGARVEIDGARLRGTLSLTGGRIDDVQLTEHYKTIEKTDNVELLNPVGTEGTFYVESGWTSAAQNIAVPDADTQWRRAAGSASVLKSGGAPVVMEWDNGQGLTFRRAVTLDDNYLFTVTQSVINNSAAPVTLNAYHLVARHGKPVDYSGFFVLHEGPIAFLGDEGHEPSYGDLEDGDKLDFDKTTGWLGLTDKYWLAAVVPSAGTTFNARFVGRKGAHGFVYQGDIVAAAQTAEPGRTIEETTYVYAGAKDKDVMQAYEAEYGFRQLVYGIDFGMWSFITKPFFILLHLLNDWTGSIAVAILLMTIVVRACIFPLTNKSFRSMARMRIVAPKLKELQEKHKDDKAALQAAIYDLYKKEDVNPFSGCWPILLQIPIVFALYKVILISVELRHAPFWGWIDDMSAPDPTSVFNLFGLLPFDPPSFLMIGAWPVLFCLTMVQLKRISPPMADPMQEKIQAWFPYIVTLLLAHFAAGLVIYWTWSNVLTILQQYYILKKVGNEDTSLLRGHKSRRKPKKAKG